MVQLWNDPEGRYSGGELKLKARPTIPFGSKRLTISSESERQPVEVARLLTSDMPATA